jgi:hypothetical protein
MTRCLAREQSIDRDADVDRAAADIQRTGSRSMDRSYKNGASFAKPSWHPTAPSNPRHRFNDALMQERSIDREKSPRTFDAA